MSISSTWLLKQTTDLCLSPHQFATIRDMLASYSGVYLDGARQRVLTAGLVERLSATGLDIDAYIDVIKQPKEWPEIHKLAELVLNHETIFFRNQSHFRALRNVILPKLHRHKEPGEPLRLWSAGCSTGEEPYSLAMTVFETFGLRPPRPFEIWATDLSERALAHAQEGCYRGRTLANVSPDVRANYFKPCNEYWQVNEVVRERVTFEKVNLLEQLPDKARGVDIIFCQNVTIYFQVATCRQLMEQFYTVLSDGGWLFLGFSETLWNIFDRFHSQKIADSFVYYKESYNSHTTQSGQQTHSAPALDSARANQGAQNTNIGTTEKSIFTFNRRQSGGEAEQPVDRSAAALEVIQRGRKLLDAGQAAEALAILCQVPLEGQYAPQLLALSAHAHANRGDLDLAVAEARRSLELDSLTTEAYLLLGIIYAQQGQFQQATQQLERARYLESDSALISFHLAETYRQLKHSTAALREYQNTLRKLTAHPPDELINGVASAWLSETCQRYIKALTGERR
jgi:chemotaxis protein methyltransferase CheR